MTSKSVRIALGLVVAATLAGLSVAAFAARSGAQPLSAGAATGVACPAVEATRDVSMCGMPVWCCPTAPLGGITVTGQATMRGSSAQVRNQAIARAVADAREQAEAAAAAAGVKLGQVLAMQISASGYPYVMEAGVATGGPGQSAPSSDGRSTLPATGSPDGVPCPAEGDCVSPSPIPVQTFVSVTVTWALA
jgi:Protein of unknown function (DUF541)